MMNDFEKHIKDNKALFDEYKADKSKLWGNIESRLDKPKPKVKIIKLWETTVFKLAATIIIGLGLFSIINIGLHMSNQQNTLAAQELNEIDMHYKGLVSYQVKLVNTNSQLSPGEKEAFLLFMDELDIEYETLKIEFQKDLDTERVLEAIVINYKKRIELIEKLLKQINSSKNMENDDVYVL